MENDKMVKASDVKEYFKRVIFGADQKIDAWVDSIPAADVRPVVRGRWGSDMQTDHCVACGHTFPAFLQLFRYCPSCGADMREPLDASSGAAGGDLKTEMA